MKKEESTEELVKVYKEEAVETLLSCIEGEDPNRTGLIETPKRVAKMYNEIFSGYQKDPADVMKVFKEKGTCDQIVLVKDIDFHSMCEHHIMPFFGKIDIAYLPNAEVGIIGLSKFARLVEIFSRRLQVQERLGEDIASSITKYLKPLGVAVFISATHTCMTMRGVNKPGSYTNTSVLTGVFRNDANARAELFQMMQI